MYLVNVCIFRRKLYGKILTYINNLFKIGIFIDESESLITEPICGDAYVDLEKELSSEGVAAASQGGRESNTWNKI